MAQKGGKETMKLTAGELIKVLAEHYEGRKSDWVFFPELRLGTGYKSTRRQACSVEQRIDAFAMCMFPSRGFERHAFEVKVSRSDWGKEMRDPLKRLPAYRVCNRFYFAVPPGLVKADEVPAEAGLVEVGDKVRVVLQAPFHESDAPHWPFIASLVRRVFKAGV